jgi:iron-sulfur cluster repair protein YtfE (RIC family)
LPGRDARRVLGQSDTLMILIQQHNLKEEQILYPMSEQLVPDGPGVLAAMRRVEGGCA